MGFVKIKKQCYEISIQTPLGQMVAIGDEHLLYLLEFEERLGLEQEIRRLSVEIIPGASPPLKMVEYELKSYFKGESFIFKTPIRIMGTPFQKKVWSQLQIIDVGQTVSYGELAQAIGRPTACRAVARANSTNQFALIIPCHRVINANGEIGGYAGGVAKKRWLLEHEANHG